MLIRRPLDVRSSEITSEEHYLERRKFMRLIGGAALGLSASSVFPGCTSEPRAADFADAGGPSVAEPQSPLANYKQKAVTTDEPLNSFEEITSYNNFYEFGMGKDDPQRYGGRLKAGEAGPRAGPT